MQVKVNLQLEGKVLEHGSLIASLFIVSAFKNSDGSHIALSYHVSCESAEEQLLFCKSAFSDLYHNFYIDDSKHISL